MYSHRRFRDVPENSHILFYENDHNLHNSKRDLQRNQISIIAVGKTPENNLRFLFLRYLTWPFVQRGWITLWTWENPEDNFQFELKTFSLKTDLQKMLNSNLETFQTYFTYTQKFSGY